MQILPSKELLPVIKHYLFLESKGMAIKRLRLFSDGNTGIVFSPKKNLALDLKNNNALDCLPNSFLYGQITEFKDIYLFSETALIIVVFQPAGIKNLLGLPANMLRDQIISIEDIFGKAGLEIEEQLFDQPVIKDQLGVLNAFFIRLISKRIYENELLVSASINFILKNRGLISVSQLVKFTGFTERHIERKFMESIGMNPKKFVNIVKLHSFLKYLKNKSDDTNLTEIAYEAGYADQSHLIKEFKNYTGMTPGIYMTGADKLAVNFVSFTPAVPKS